MLSLRLQSTSIVVVVTTLYGVLRLGGAQLSIPGVGSCDGSTSVMYIQDPGDVCRVYGCSNGQFILPQSFRCPHDITELPGIGNPCSQCPQRQQQPVQPSLQSVAGGRVSPYDSPQFNAFLGQLFGGSSSAFIPPINSRFPVPQYSAGAQPGVPNGFVSSLSGVQQPGGYRLLVGASLRQCLDACLMTSYCLAVDYDVTAGDCYVHGTATYCNDVISQTNVDHYERVTCSAATGILNSAVEVWSGYRVANTTSGLQQQQQQQQPLCTRCRLVDCLVQCYTLSSRCGGVDYDSTATTCFLLNVSTACGSLTPAASFVHVTTSSCSATSIGGSSSGSLAPSGGGSAAVYSNFVAVRYFGPTSLPLNWLGFPGSRVVGGTLVARGTTGDNCVSLCQLYVSCYAVDFNSVDGTCWAHTTAQTKCGAPLPTNYVYHVKKPPACGYITGTYQPYPLPVTVGASEI